jgi:hypothetical protein
MTQGIHRGSELITGPGNDPVNRVHWFSSWGAGLSGNQLVFPGYIFEFTGSFTLVSMLGIERIWRFQSICFRKVIYMLIGSLLANNCYASLRCEGD